MYYLQSRYYDPLVGRFINADVYASTGQGILGCNMFAYCENGVILKYIYETYGMEKTMELLKSDADFEKVLGKSLDYIYFEAADFAKKEIKRIEAERGKTK